MTKRCNGLDDLVSGFRPYEGLGFFIVHFEVFQDGGLQLVRTPMNASADLFVCQIGEPALDQVEPRCARGYEMQMETWMTQKPTLDRGRLMSGVVVQDQMHVERRRHLAIDVDEELPKLSGTVSPIALAHHLACRDVQSCE